MTRVFVHSRSNSGHHAEYNRLLEKEFEFLGAAVQFWGRPTTALAARHVFFSMIDGNWPHFFLCAMLSCATGQRLGGLLFRPGECFRRDSIIYRVKYVLFRALKLLPRVTILTIMPFSVDRRFAEIAHDWVHDPQLWDRQTLDHLKSDASTPLSSMIVDLAKGRSLIVALGAQNRSKGFDYLCEVWLASPALRMRYLMVAAGRVAEESRGLEKLFREAGGVVVDRFVSEQELSSLYAVADVVWAAFHPNYDQASGVIGRAFQFGIPVIVRQGSYMGLLMRELDHQTVEIGHDDPSLGAKRLLAAETGLARRPYRRDAAIEMRRIFVRKLAGSLSIGEARARDSPAYE